MPSPAELRETIRRSGLLGRGGGQFPIAKKLDLVAASAAGLGTAGLGPAGLGPVGRPLVVVNASEGEPASRKDRTLLAARPHLVLDGAMVAARAAGAPEVIVYLHRSSRDATAALERALFERTALDVPVRVVDAPSRYIAGESTAVVSYLESRGALPGRRPAPVAAAGVGGRPTLLNNVETITHLALIARFGPGWFADAGDASSPGSTLVTLAGEVAVPGVVAEVVGRTTMGELLFTIGGLDRPPRAVLVGGYEGAWLDGEAAWNAPAWRGGLAGRGVSLGSGVIAALGQGSCGLASTARLVRWLAGESAGQCGACTLGLPAIAALLDSLAEGSALRRDIRRLRALTTSVQGRGACGHPDGVAGLVDTALETFADEVREHLRGRSCPPAVTGFPLPRRT
jgi:NADH:ubiquinone oxidoreductase subunit F (NADH-binding)